MRSTKSEGKIIVAIRLEMGTNTAAVRLKEAALGTFRASRGAALPAGVLLAGWALSGWLYLRMDQGRLAYDEARRDSIVASIEGEIRTRMAVYEDVLRGAAGFLAVSGPPSREDWRIYVNRLRLADRYPGTEVISFIQLVPHAQLESFVTEQRRGGLPDFKIRAAYGPPSSVTPAEHFIVTCAEPPKVALRALGSDLTTEPRRRIAAERARDSGMAALTRNTVLLNGAGEALQLFVPVYRKGAPIATMAERREALTGWVALVIAVDAFFRSAMVGREAFVNLRVFDGTAAPGNLMFASNGVSAATRPFERTTGLVLAGNAWTLGWNRTPEFPFVSKTPSVLAAGCMALLSIVFAGLVVNLQFTGKRAEVLLAIKEKQAAETQSFLASIVQSSDDSIIGTLLDGSIVSWNQGAERVWGYTAKEAIGKHITILFPPGRKQDYLNTLTSVKRDERIERFESVRVRKDGTPLDVSVILSPIKNTGGELVGVSAIYHDITERKQAEVELLRAKEAAEAASQAKSEFLANMSHEIRTPMNGVLVMTELVLDSELNPEQREYLTVAKSSADALLSVINDILDFSKIEAGMLDLDLREFRLRNSIEETMKALAPSAHQKGLELGCAIHGSVPDAIRGDALRIRQVLVNLVGNAVKFTERGEVVVSVEARPRSAEGPGTGSGLELHFAVRDTGIGIYREKLQTIFQAFTQADNSTTRQYGGTGLGLTISKHLVEMMGGRIWVESEPQQGSKFSFAIPIGFVESQPLVPALDCASLR